MQSVGTRVIGRAINVQLRQLPGTQTPIEPIFLSLRHIVSLLPGLESELQTGLEALMPAVEERSLCCYLEQLGRLMELMEDSGRRGFYRCAGRLMRLARRTEAWARLRSRSHAGGPPFDAATETTSENWISADHLMTAAPDSASAAAVGANLLSLTGRLAGVGCRVGAILLQFSVSTPDSEGTAAVHCYHCVAVDGACSEGQPAAAHEVRAVGSAAEADAAIRESARRFRKLGGQRQRKQEQDVEEPEMLLRLMMSPRREQESQSLQKRENLWEEQSDIPMLGSQLLEESVQESSLLPRQKEHQQEQSLLLENQHSVNTVSDRLIQEPDHRADPVQQPLLNTQNQKTSLAEQQWPGQDQWLPLLKHHSEQDNDLLIQSREQYKQNLTPEVEQLHEQVKQEENQHKQSNQQEPLQLLLQQKDQWEHQLPVHGRNKEEKQLPIYEQQLEEKDQILLQKPPSTWKLPSKNVQRVDDYEELDRQKHGLVNEQQQSLSHTQAESEQRPVSTLQSEEQQLLITNKHKQSDSPFQKEMETEAKLLLQQTEQLQSQPHIGLEPLSLLHVQKEHPHLQNRQQVADLHMPHIQNQAHQLEQNQQQENCISRFRTTTGVARLQRLWTLENCTSLGDAAAVVATSLSDCASAQPDRESSRTAAILEDGNVSGSTVEEGNALRNLLQATVTTLQDAHLVSESQPDLASTKTQTTTSCESHDDPPAVGEGNGSEVQSAATKLAMRRVPVKTAKQGSRAEAQSSAHRRLRRQSARVRESGERRQRRSKGADTVDDAALTTPSDADRGRVSSSRGTVFTAMLTADKRSTHPGSPVIRSAPKEVKNKSLRSEDKVRNAVERKRGERTAAAKHSPLPAERKIGTNKKCAKLGDEEIKKGSSDVRETQRSKRASKPGKSQTESKPKSTEGDKKSDKKCQKKQVPEETSKPSSSVKDAKGSSKASKQDSDSNQLRMAPQEQKMGAKEVENKLLGNPCADGAAASHRKSKPPAGRTKKLERRPSTAGQVEALPVSVSNYDVNVAARGPARTKDKTAKLDRRKAQTKERGSN